MSQQFLWDEVCKLLKSQSPEAEVKFTELLLKAKEERLSLLTRTIEFLNAEGHELFYVSGICTFIQSILKLMIHSYQISYDAVCDMLNFIIVEARHFSSCALVKNVTYCLDYMTSNDTVDLPMRWIEVFGKIVAVLATRGEIEINGDTISGQDYKQEVIVAICRIHWGQQNGASLVSALREIPGIDSNDVKMVLEKAGTSIRILEPTSIPPMAYQLLLLAGSNFPSLIISYFDDYFSGVDFSTETRTEGSTLMNKKKSLGNTVYHFVQRARQSEPLLKEFTKRIKASQFHHSLFVSPFMISVALGLTGIDHVKPVIIDALKTTIVKWFMEIHWSKSIRWYHDSSEANVNNLITSCFSRAIDSRTSELDFMLDGMKELGISLLNMDNLGVKEIQLAKQQCIAIGDYLLTSIVSKEKDYLPAMMNEFLKNQTSVANIECLGHCLKKVVSPFVRKKFVGRITELIHHLPLMTVETAVPILKALLPALQLSYDLLGEVVMVLRKTIWKSVEARRISVTAMILLLSNSRIVGDIPRSQYSCSQNFASSQLAGSQTNILGASNKNESICFEVLSILKRFFSQQLEVREHLYIGLYNVARQNPELISFLCSHIQTQVQSHMTTGYQSIRLDKIIEFSEGQTVLIEPLGFLLQCMCLLVTKSRQIFENSDGDYSDETPTSVLGCVGLVKTWIVGIGNITYEDFNKISSNLLPPGKTVEVSHQLKCELMIQAMQVIEALIEYLCLGGAANEPNDLSTLFTKFRELTQGLKPTLFSKKDKKIKPKKKDTEKVKHNESDTTLQLSAASSTAGDFLPPKSKDTSPKKLVFSHIMAIEHLSEIIGKLYSPTEEFDQVDPLRPLRNKTDFDFFLLGILKQKLYSLKCNESLKEREKDVNVLNSHLAKISHFLWNRVDNEVSLARLPTGEDELVVLETDAVKVDELRLELIAEILDYLFMNFPSDRHSTLARFLNEVIQGKTYNDLFTEFFDQFIQHVQQARKYVLDKREGRGVNYLFKILQIVSLELSNDTTDVLAGVLTWFSELFEGKAPIFPTPETGPNTHHAEAIMSTFISISSKMDVVPERFLALAKQAHFFMHDLDGVTASFAPRNSTENCWLVTETTATTVLHQLSLYTEQTLSVMKDFIGRLNCIYIDDKKVSSWRNNCCTVLIFLMKLLSHFVRSKFPIGPWVDVIRRTAVQFFNVTTSITENFVSYHARTSVAFRSKPFEELVKEIGTDFKIRAEAMIHHIEEIRRKALGDVGNKKRANSAKVGIVNDTKTIPALVYSMEKYEQQLIALCQKTKVNFLAGMRLSAARDFRIMFKNLKNPNTKHTTFAEAAEDVVSAEENDESSTTNDTRTRKSNKAGPSKSSSRPNVANSISSNQIARKFNVSNDNRKQPELSKTIKTVLTLPKASTVVSIPTSVLATSNSEDLSTIHSPSKILYTPQAIPLSMSRPGPLCSKTPNANRPAPLSVKNRRLGTPAAAATSITTHSIETLVNVPENETDRRERELSLSPIISSGRRTVHATPPPLPTELSSEVQKFFRPASVSAMSSILPPIVEESAQFDVRFNSDDSSDGEGDNYGSATTRHLKSTTPVDIIYDSDTNPLPNPIRPVPTSVSDDDDDEEDDDEMVGTLGGPSWGGGINPTPLASSGFVRASVKRKLYNDGNDIGKNVMESSQGQSKPKMKRLGLGRARLS